VESYAGFWVHPAVWVIGYLIFGIICSCVWARYFYREGQDLPPAFLVFVWPIIVMVFVIGGVTTGLNEFALLFKKDNKKENKNGWE